MRHKVLAALLPFLLSTVGWTLEGCVQGIQYHLDPRSLHFPEKSLLHDAMDGALMLFAIACWGIVAFLDDMRYLFDHYWFAYPWYVIPYVCFLFARKRWAAAILYCLYFCLVILSVFDGVRVAVRLMP